MATCGAVISPDKRRQTFAIGSNIKDSWLGSLVQWNRHGRQQNLRRIISSFCGKIKMKNGCWGA